MSKTALTYAETVAFILAIGASAHYLGGLDWPWAIVIGAIGSVVLRLLIHSRPLRAWRKRPAPRGR